MRESTLRSELSTNGQRIDNGSLASSREISLYRILHSIDRRAVVLCRPGVEALLETENVY